MKIRVAVFGAGMGWPPHRESLRDLAHRVEVGWLVGRGLDRVREHAACFETARATNSIDEVLADRGVRAALVLTPPNTHLGIVRALAARGIDVLLEKPLEVDSARAAELVTSCERAGVRLGVVLQHRMWPAAQRLKSLLAEGALGTLTSAAVEVRLWRPQSYYDQPGRGTRARDGGGVLMTQAIHTLDLFMHLAGAPLEVAAFATTSAAHRMECEDSVAAALRLPGGVPATLSATTAAYPGFGERIELAGTLGSASLAGGELRLRRIDGGDERFGAGGAHGVGADPMAFPHEAHRALIADFLDAIEQQRDPAVGGRDGLRVQRLIDAILESASTRRVVAPRGDEPAAR